MRFLAGLYFIILMLRIFLPGPGTYHDPQPVANHQSAKFWLSIILGILSLVIIVLVLV